MSPTDYKKYYKEHKSVILERSKKRYLENKSHCNSVSLKYYHSNRDRLNNNYKIKITCECGGRHTKNQTKRHSRTKKHKRYLEELALKAGIILVDEIDQIE